MNEFTWENLRFWSIVIENLQHPKFLEKPKQQRQIKTGLLKNRGDYYDPEEQSSPRWITWEDGKEMAGY